MRRIWIVLSVMLLAAVAQAQSPSTPYPGPARIIGADAAGCIAGAVRLPDTAPGMQTIRLSRSTFWGHPDVIANLLDLAKRAQAAGLPDLYMNDISLPRGGPMAGIHASHMIGVDADVWLDVAGPHPVLPLAERETIEPHTLVRPDGRGVDMNYWRPEHIALIRLGATEKGIDRVLVNPAIKRQLCQQATGDRSWLRFVRPWYGHATHMHLHFKCPAGQTECTDMAPPPPGDGCDASLQWWFDQLDRKPEKPETTAPAPKPKPIALPAACKAIMAAP